MDTEKIENITNPIPPLPHDSRVRNDYECTEGWADDVSRCISACIARKRLNVDSALSMGLPRGEGARASESKAST